MRDVWATPRPVPTTYVPQLAAAVLNALALPVFVVSWLVGALGTGAR